MMNNFQLPVILKNRNQRMAMENRISLVSPFLKCCQKLHIFQLMNVKKTTEHAQLIVKQAEEHTRRKLDLLEQSFELKKQKILDEELQAKNNTDLVVFQNL